MNTLQRSSEIMGRESVRKYWLSDCSEQWVRKGKREQHGKADWMCLVNVRGVVYVAVVVSHLMVIYSAARLMFDLVQ